ncbi:MAG TPA: histidine--tRNA ligase [Dermatophilaceae bacterium]|nr:histidine--tRNA ligase [Dermatophilaceae bacterium]
MSSEPRPRAERVTPLSGFPELLPAERILEQQLLDVIRRTFELHGFAPLETRAVEPVDRLLGKGGDADKEIYAVSRLAAGADAAPGDGGEEARLGLHFDLTVPFARYVLENAGRLQFPFRRYQIQKVWRGERPQEGRFREFTQADVDVVDVGELAPHFEAEIPLVVADAFSRLPVGPFRIHVNDRRVCEGFYLGIGLTDVVGTLRAVDKLDKVGPEAVTAMIVATGATADQAERCLALAAIRSEDLSFVEQVRGLRVEHPLLDDGLEALSAVVATGMERAPGTLLADLHIARGLDYYTGAVYETFLVGDEDYGSVCSGGRYDSLATDGRVTYPGVGISIGLTRLLHLLLTRRGLSASRSTPSCVLVAVPDEAGRPASVGVATALRARGVPCEVAPSAAKFGKQIRYADRRGIPYVWFPAGPGAAGAPAGRGHEVKDVRSGEQVPADPGAWLPPAADLRPVVVSR